MKKTKQLRIMKKINLLFVLLVVAAAGFAQKQFVVDPNAELRALNGSYNKIKVSNAIDLYLSQSDNESLAVSASEEKFKAGIKTKVENNVLKIYYEGDRNWAGKNRKLKVYVSFRDLRELEASGASDIVVAGILKVDNLKLSLSGASDFKGNIQADRLEVESSGASDITVSGSAKTVTISNSGASDFKGYDFETENCTVNCSGASDVEITVSKEISAQASGASNVYFKGNAVMKNIQASGSSNINKKG